MSYRDQFTTSEWQTLQFAPLWIFTMVAGVDGRVEEKELEILAKTLASSALHRNPLVREVMFSVGINFSEVWPAYQRDSRNVLEGLRDVRHLLDQKVSSSEAAGFKDAVLALGVQLIEKGGTGILGGIFGKKDKRKQKIAWGLAAVALGLRPTD